MLPAILYIPLMGGSYFIFDLFHAEKAEIPDKTLQTTEFLNPELPDAQIKDGDGIGRDPAVLTLPEFIYSTYNSLLESGIPDSAGRGC